MCCGSHLSDDVISALQVQTCPTGPAPTVCPGGFLYGVLPGDTLFTIGRAFGVGVQAVINANPQVSNPGVLLPGQVVCVPVAFPLGRPPAPPACVGGCLYGVQPGDTFFLIARRFGVSLQAIIAANPQVVNPNAIVPSQVVCVPAIVPAIDVCVLLLNRTALVPQSATGVALVIQVPPEAASNVLVTTLLPPPGTITPGVGFTVYIAWLRGTPRGTIKMPLEVNSQPPLQRWEGGVSAGGAAIIPFSDLIVTVEPNALVTTPSGPVVLRASFNECR